MEKEIIYISPQELPPCPDGRACEIADILMTLANGNALGHETPVSLSSALQSCNPLFNDSKGELRKCVPRCAAAVISRVYPREVLTACYLNFAHSYRHLL